MNLKSKISLFRNYIDPTPVMGITVYQFYENIIYCDYEDEITQIRAGNKTLKKQLPGVTISGLFTKRGNSNLIKHSGFIAIDIDAKDNPTINDWDNLRDTIGTWNEVLMASLSVSGKGLFLVMPLFYPHKHKEQFMAIEKDFAAMNLIVDPSCKDISRLRGISSDPKATWNSNAQPYKKLLIESKTATPVNNVVTPDVAKLISWTESKVGLFAKGNRNRFITQLAGAAHRLGIPQHEVENQLKQYSQNDFTEREILSTIKSIYANKSFAR
ncbi:MAG: primase C-terminal domain-containing protein [Bacteroidales bacterium]|nr:primase C-terminal domain-containing protein [Bacteroidales bacterium]MBN2749047.1 primase C-terminal domain-containing protein [Bacteroidales bacterium]